jgi:hypothetical protein
MERGLKRLAIGEPDKLDYYVLRLSCVSPVNMGTRGDVVDESVDTSTWLYAVISVRSEPDRERLVIAYPDDETLRNLIAAPSIVALGYTSRADALKNIDRCVTTKTSLKRLLKTLTFHPNMTFLTECRAALRRFAAGFGRSGSSRVMRNLLHNGLAGTLIVFYSRNVLSRTVRAFLSC